MPEIPPVEQLDYLLEKGDRFAILGSGERVEPGEGGLPADAGTHLVAGTARKGVRNSRSCRLAGPGSTPAGAGSGSKATRSRHCICSTCRIPSVRHSDLSRWG